MIDRVRGELEEYVASFFSGDLQLPEPNSQENTTLPDFKNVFVKTNGRLKIEEEKLHDYIDGLKQCYSSEDESNGAVLGLFDRLSTRRDKIFKETNEIDTLDGEYEIKRNARYAFAHIVMIYYSIQFVRAELGL